MNSHNLGDSLPRGEAHEPPLLQLRGLRKTFRARGTAEPVNAVDGVSLDVRRGESVGLVGESGSGKTTLGRCVVRLEEPSDGEVRFAGQDVTHIRSGGLRHLHSKAQMVFQDPYDSLNPRMNVAALLDEPLALTGLPRVARGRRIAELLDLVRLDRSFLGRYPHQMSGGQQQRVGIARALAREPALLVLDEPTSALDWLVRGEILKLLARLRRQLDLTYLVISHDLSVIAEVCERVYVMYLGRIIEEAPARLAFSRPQHPYTRALMSAVLHPDPNQATRRRLHLKGDPPESTAVAALRGCRFFSRCPIGVPECSVTDQELLPMGARHLVACMRVSAREQIEWPDGWEEHPGAYLADMSTG